MQGPTTWYYHLDRLGSVRLVTKQSTTPTFQNTYQPYGASSATSGSEMFQYTGKQLDSATGLYYYGYRYYDSQTGRFLSQDSAPPNYLNPQSINGYIYALDNPLLYVDPDGGVAQQTDPSRPDRSASGSGSETKASGSGSKSGGASGADPSGSRGAGGSRAQGGGAPGPANIDLSASRGLSSVANGGTPGPANIDLASSRGLTSVANGGTPGPGNIDLQNRGEQGLGTSGPSSLDPSLRTSNPTPMRTSQTANNWTHRQQMGAIQIIEGSAILTGGLALSIGGPFVAPEFAPMEVSVGIGMAGLGVQLIRGGIGLLTTPNG